MVAGERRRPAASSAAETVMGSPPNRTTDGARCPTSARASPTASPPRSCSCFAMAKRTPAARQPDTRPSSEPVVGAAATGALALAEEPPSRRALPTLVTGAASTRSAAHECFAFAEHRVWPLHLHQAHVNESWFGTTPLLYHRAPQHSEPGVASLSPTSVPAGPETGL